jgi:glycosyltransferase involved in cell wall biosynthesis
VSVRPLISVILPTHNRGAYLRDAVGSVLAQTHDPWELVVVDDGSTDGTRAFLEGIADRRVRPIFRPRQGNAAALRNVGVEAARGSHVAFLDSDDLWLPEKLAAQITDLLAHPECRWSYVGRVCVDEDGAELQGPEIRPFVPYGGWILEHVIDLRALIATSAVMVERRLFEEVGGFNEALLRCQDSDLWIKLAETSPAAVVPTILVKKRVHLEDRETDQLKVQGYMNRIYGDLLARNGSATIRRLCRRRRARVNLDIADGLRRAGRYAEARRALVVAARFAGWRVAWWATLLKTLARPLLPAHLRDRYALRRRHRPQPNRPGPLDAAARRITSR